MTCPVCQARAAEVLLHLKGSPIYQHPVPPDARVPGPYTIDLTYFYCAACGHAYQADFNAALMDQVYQSYYYTPAPEGIGATFRHEFIAFAGPHITRLPAGAGILEICSSSGELLADIGKLRPDAALLGFEPSEVTARKAQANGINTLLTFFGPQTVAEAGRRFDCIIARHVIEHITGFDHFFAALEAASAGADTLLLLETPALDAHWQAISIAPFHVEHAHVFSVHSLAALARRYAWHLTGFRVTESQNLIAVFARSPAPAIAVSLPSARASYGDYFAAFRRRLAALAQGRKLVLWGAGSGGIKLMNYHQLPIAHLVDGNPEKKGMKFLGVDLPIEYAQERIAAITQSGRDGDYAVLIGSGFYREIGEILRAAGWRGGVLTPYAPDFLAGERAKE